MLNTNERILIADALRAQAEAIAGQSERAAGDLLALADRIEPRLTGWAADVYANERPL